MVTAFQLSYALRLIRLSHSCHTGRVTHPVPDTPAGYPSRTPKRGVRLPDDWLRYLPPTAALTVAFVLQVVAVTDLLGAGLADRWADTRHAWLPYLLAGLVGIAVAVSLEGGAAYLMGQYEKRLVARISAWQIRLAMIVYVGISAVLIHWWLSQRGLPELLAWVLGGMSASALWLWAQGSRWAQREAMISAGQMDPALPRLPIASKLLHPIRWVVTLYLISWEPVSTTDQARTRYADWRDRPRWWSRTPAQPPVPDTRAALAPPTRAVAADTGNGQPTNRRLATVRSITSRTPRPDRSEVSIEDLARELDRSFPDRVPGVPTAMPHLKARFGSCARGRAKAAVKRLSEMRSGGQSADDDKEGESAWAV